MAAPTTPDPNRENQPTNGWHSWSSPVLVAENKNQNLILTPPYSGAFAV